MQTPRLGRIAAARAALRAVLIKAARPLRVVHLVLGTKDATEEIGNYSDLLFSYIAQALDGSMSKTDFARAHRALIREYGPSAYIASLEECGVPEEDMTEDDDAAIEGWVSEQVGYVGEFADALIAARGDEAAIARMEARGQMWGSALESLATRACMSAKSDVMGTWEFDPQKEHCEAHDGRVSCAWLNGKRHRLSWFLKYGYIPQEPGSETLGCGGWECGCKIVDDKGRQLLP